MFTGVYARLYFPTLTANGIKIPLDSVMPTFVVSRFPVYLAIVIILGMISAGMSTLEGLIQSLSTTITADIIKPLTGNKIIKEDGGKGFIPALIFNRLVIAILAIVAITISYQQLMHPVLSVGILAQNGVYAFFSAAFIPVVFGIFLRDVNKLIPITASVTALLVHFSVYYLRLTPYMQNTVRNPGVASAMAIICSVAVGGVLYVAFKRKPQLATA